MITYSNKTCLLCGKTYTPASAPQKVCADCKKEYKRLYKRKFRELNKDREVEVRKKWYWENLAQVRQYKRNWNNTKGVEYRKKYYADKKEEVSKRLKENYGWQAKGRSEANHLLKKLKWAKICSKCKSIEKINIHHKDHNPLNNDLANLLLLCRVCHIELHVQERLPQ